MYLTFFKYIDLTKTRVNVVNIILLLFNALFSCYILYRNKLYIKTSEHHKGQGTQLLKHLFDLLPKDHNLRLTVNRKNYKAINYYFKNGFVIEEVKDFDIGDGFFMKDFVMLRKASF